MEEAQVSKHPTLIVSTDTYNVHVATSQMKGSHLWIFVANECAIESESTASFSA